MEKNLLTRIKWKNYINYIGVGLFVLVFTLMSLTSGLPSSTLYLLEKIAISIILAVSLSLVVGFLGELSLGHAGFMCIGAYIGGKLASVLEGVLGYHRRWRLRGCFRCYHRSARSSTEGRLSGDRYSRIRRDRKNNFQKYVKRVLWRNAGTSYPQIR